MTITTVMSEPYPDLSEPPKASSALAKQPRVAWLAISCISPLQPFAFHARKRHFRIRESPNFRIDDFMRGRFGIQLAEGRI